MIELGLRRGAIEHRLECERLIRVHRAVYAVGHRLLSAEASWMAAVLAAGPDAVLSHRSACALWGMRRDGRETVDVTVRSVRKRRPGIRLHSTQLLFDETTAVRGIPVTSMSRTLLDLAAIANHHQVERAAERAEALRLTDPLQLGDLLARYPGRRGIATIRALALQGELAPAVTRSEFEDRFLAFVTKMRLPRPLVNAPLELSDRWIEVDCLWRAQRLVVELEPCGRSRTGSLSRDAG